MAQANPKMVLSKTKVFNDPIHGHIELHPLLVHFIDTPQFQRLRYIKQLGGSYYVFPGASHNRFEHSIGVAYLAGCLVKELQKKQPELNIDDKDVLCVQIAGLCHDLGHGPFSHVFEKRFMLRAAPQEKFKHEKASEKMLEHLIETNKLRGLMNDCGLYNDDEKFIKEMIIGLDEEHLDWSNRGKDKRFLYEIVANKASGVDVDKMDYFARDCHHLGMQNNFDYKRFFAFARVCEANNEKHICIRDKEVWNMYDFFYTRYGLHKRAYQHRVCNIIEIMITDAIVKADAEPNVKTERSNGDADAKPNVKTERSDREHFKISGSVDNMAAYTRLTDDYVIQLILQSSDARKIWNKIERRELYSFLGQTQPTRTEKSKDRKLSDKECRKYEAELAGEDETHPKLKPEDFRVDIIDFDYGKKEEDPVGKMWFYTKSNLNKGVKITREQVAHILPEKFKEQIIRVYCTTTDLEAATCPEAAERLEAAKIRFKEWCMDKNLKILEHKEDQDSTSPCV